ncbi:hypothetical protein Q7C_183 [Methylophaga frappieri]|uniref:Uncharacterized protein n=1 Tax=Methylophaga frappieri (strain ATCC BAA-2434 / DSM 25690 / JAM7) TaxID=754477 RepID=I1YEM1_METFJ|nr:hypothetical protein Q7C_183 [Methylophaga frappieri]
MKKHQFVIENEQYACVISNITTDKNNFSIPIFYAINRLKQDKGDV